MFWQSNARKRLWFDSMALVVVQLLYVPSTMVVTKIRWQRSRFFTSNYNWFKKFYKHFLYVDKHIQIHKKSFQVCLIILLLRHVILLTGCTDKRLQLLINYIYTFSSWKHYDWIMPPGDNIYQWDPYCSQ